MSQSLYNKYFEHRLASSFNLHSNARRKVLLKAHFRNENTET